jgi:hypothetical protein
MRKQAARRLLAIMRLFVAATTLMLLTATVWYQPDHDGYQGTHLFFTPRRNWEMDKGRGMLYEEEHYEYVDRLHSYGERAFESEYEDEGDYESYSSYEQGDEDEYGEIELGDESSRPTVRRMHHAPRMPENQLPSDCCFEATPFYFGQPTMVELIVARPNSWLGEVPTPPPRS